MQTSYPEKKQGLSPAHKILLTLAGLIIILGWWLTGALPQNPDYQLFADQRILLNLPHAMDVLSNLPFCLVGIIGIYATIFRRHQLDDRTLLYLTFFGAVFATGLGSAYYHFNPDNSTLVWDRLPMAVGFMSIFAAIVAERINLKLGRALFPWLIAAGLCSVFYWQWQDDLRPYVLVQFGTLLALPVIVWIHRRADSAYIWLAMGFYLLAKFFEFYDAQIYTLAGEWISGHSLKHMAAAMTPFFILLKLRAEIIKAAQPNGVLQMIPAKQVKA